MAKSVGSAKRASGSIIKSCNCKSEYQDKKYGKNNRVFNMTAKGARCTICLSNSN